MVGDPGAGGEVGRQLGARQLHLRLLLGDPERRAPRARCWSVSARPTAASGGRHPSGVERRRLTASGAVERPAEQGVEIGAGAGQEATGLVRLARRLGRRQLGLERVETGHVAGLEAGAGGVAGALGQALQLGRLLRAPLRRREGEVGAAHLVAGVAEQARDLRLAAPRLGVRQRRSARRRLPPRSIGTESGRRVARIVLAPPRAQLRIGALARHVPPRRRLRPPQPRGGEGRAGREGGGHRLVQGQRLLRSLAGQGSRGEQREDYGEAFSGEPQVPGSSPR